MPFDLSYMGTKRHLADDVSSIIRQAPDGPVLDAFSGMCAVGMAVGSARSVWNNDVQKFAFSVANCLFVSQEAPPDQKTVAHHLYRYFTENRAVLQERYERQIATASRLLQPRSAFLTKAYERITSPTSAIGGAKCEERSGRRSNAHFPYTLFVETYSDTYFGLEQCVEIDSVVYGIDRLVELSLLSTEGRTWLLLALGQTMKSIATTTGHFAQFLEPSEKTINRHVQQRKRSVWNEFVDNVAKNLPVGSKPWRSTNRVFNADSVALVENFQSQSDVPRVIYADPPYTEDQYSRYYHILETLMLYDYPEVRSKARYRRERYSTAFSMKARVVQAFESLVSGTARIGADLILSYPAEGLLHRTGANPRDVLAKHYRRVEVCSRIEHEHSTFGASKGSATAPVTEIIYWAKG
jgi:adenine-specific DNA-methyltransferase